LIGDVIRWEQQVRFRHMPTRQYLCISSDRRVTVTPDAKDPRTVFRLHPVIKVRFIHQDGIIMIILVACILHCSISLSDTTRLAIQIIKLE